jgi:hypothetical protein
VPLALAPAANDVAGVDVTRTFVGAGLACVVRCHVWVKIFPACVHLVGEFFPVHVGVLNQQRVSRFSRVDLEAAPASSGSWSC